jgi:putative PEP-CTERM system TPR-repeat lipoprotein
MQIVRALALIAGLVLVPALAQDKADLGGLRQAVRDDPANPERRLALGVAELRLGDFEGAERDLTMARDRGMAPSRVLPPLGLAMLHMGRYDELTRWQSSCEEQPCAAAVAGLRARAMLHLKLLDEAHRLIEQALSAVPRSIDAQFAQADWMTASGAAQQSEKQIDQLIAGGAADAVAEPAVTRADLLAAKGDLRRRAGDFAGAEAAYRSELALLPGADTGRSRLVLSLIAQGRFDDARAELRPLVTRPRQSLITVYLDALAQTGQDHPAEALATLRRAERQLGETPQGSLLLGVVQAANGNLEEARGYTGHFLSVQQGDLPSALLLARINFGLGEFSRAIDLLSPVQGQIKDRAEILELLGSAYLAMGNNADAVRLLTAAERLSPRSPIALARRALAQTRLPDRAAEGIAELETLAGQDPADRAIGLVLIEVYLGRGDISKAAAAAGRLVAGRPDDALARTVRGSVARLKGDAAGAEADFKAARALAEGFEPATLGLADLYIGAGRLDEAQALIRPVLEKHPSDIGFLLASAALEQRRGNAAAVKAALDTATVAQADDIVAQANLLQSLLAMGEQDRAARRASLLANNWASDAAALDLAARVLLQTGRRAEALTLFRQMQAILPPSVETSLRQAELSMRTEQLGDAQASLDRALQLEPGNPSALAERIAVEYGRAGAAQAAALAKTLFSHLQGPEPALQAVDRLSRQGQDPAVATIAARALFDLHPAPASARRCGLALMRAGDGAGAQKLLSDWLAHNADDADSRALLAELMMRQGDKSQAAEQWALALARQPDNAVAANNLAWLYGKLGDPRALDMARRAYRLDPDRAQVADTYGVLLFGGGDKKMAADLLRAAHAGDPAQPLFAYHLACVLAESGDRDGARALLRPLVEGQAVFEDADDARQLYDRLRG